MSDGVSMIPGVRGVRDELDKWQRLRGELEALDDMDAKCLSDTLDGETDLKEALLVIEQEVAEREAMSESIALRLKDLQARRDRVEKSTETLRNIILQAMDRAGIPKIQGESATLSVSYYGPDIFIENEAVIPSAYWVAQDPRLDRKAVKEAVKAGVEVPGVSKTNGRVSLTIRRK